MRLPLRGSSLARFTIPLMAPALLHCSSGSNSSSSSGMVDCSSVKPDAGMTASLDTCYPDNDGINDQTYTIDIAVDDTGFTSTGGDDAGAKNIIATQNSSQVTLKLTNNGTKPHGFTVGCISVCSSYPDAPHGLLPDGVLPLELHHRAHRSGDERQHHVRHADARWAHLPVLLGAPGDARSRD